MKKWFYIASNELKKNNYDWIIDFIEYYEKEIEEAKKEIIPEGYIKTALAKIGSLFEYRYSQLQDIEAVISLLEIEQTVRFKTEYEKFVQTYNRQLTENQIKKFVNSSQSMIEISEIILRISYIRNLFLGVIKGLEQNSYALTNIVKLVVASMEDAVINSKN